MSNFYDKTYDYVTRSEFQLKSFHDHHPSAEGWEEWLRGNLPDLWGAIQKAELQSKKAYRKLPIRTYRQRLRNWAKLCLEGMRVFKEMHLLFDGSSSEWDSYEEIPEGFSVKFFDLESQFLASEKGGWGKESLRQLRCSFATVFDTKDWECRVYDEATVKGESGLIADLLSADVVVGFNHMFFDYEVLRGYEPDAPFEQVKNIDVMVDLECYLQYRVRQENLCQATLGEGKEGVGTQAVAWWRDREWAKLISYNIGDVKTLHNAFWFGFVNGFVRVTARGGKIVEIPTDHWKDWRMRTQAVGQMTLFDGQVEAPLSKRRGKSKVRSVDADHDFSARRAR